MTRKELYKQLALRYKYTPDQIASMNDIQKLNLLSDDDEDDTITFDTFEEYLEYKAEKDK